MASVLSPDIDTCEVCGTDKHVEYTVIGDLFRIMLCMHCSNRFTRASIHAGHQKYLQCVESKIRAIENGVDETITRIKSEIEELYDLRNFHQGNMLDYIDHWLKYEARV